MILFRALFWLTAVAVLFPQDTAPGRAEVLAALGVPAFAAPAGQTGSLDALRHRAAERLQRAKDEIEAGQST